jgi:chromosome partitioning protein
MKVISILNQKGGCGKTTIAVNLSKGIAVRRHKVMLIDADPQGSILNWKGVSGEHSFQITHYTRDDIHKVIPDIKGYDYIVIDSPPGVLGVTKSILVSSDEVILPVGPSPLDLWSVNETISLIKEAQGVHQKLRGRILISKKIPNTRIGKEIRDALEGYGLKVMKAEISQRVSYVEAMIAGQSVLDYKPDSEAAKEIMDLTKEILNERG